MGCDFFAMDTPSDWDAIGPDTLYFQLAWMGMGWMVTLLDEAGVMDFESSKPVFPRVVVCESRREAAGDDALDAGCARAVAPAASPAGRQGAGYGGNRGQEPSDGAPAAEHAIECARETLRRAASDFPVAGREVLAE
jgi:hypothetical protein